MAVAAEQRLGSIHREHAKKSLRLTHHHYHDAYIEQQYKNDGFFVSTFRHLIPFLMERVARGVGQGQHKVLMAKRIYLGDGQTLPMGSQKKYAKTEKKRWLSNCVHMHNESL